MTRNFIDGVWEDAKGTNRWTSRAPGDHSDALGTFTEDVGAVADAVAAARAAQPAWEAIGLAERARHLEALSAAFAARVDEITDRIAREVGKPAWEARGEAGALASKIRATLDVGMQDVQGQLLPGASHWTDGGYQYRPLGVCAVLGPFNFPLHLANGHIIAALATGNTCVFKPSELAPSCADIYMECVEAAKLPPGVLNMVQGQREAGVALVSHPDVNAVLFTGSVKTGVAIRRATIEQPWKLLALELGGKNTAVVLADAQLERAAYEIGIGALLTCGQRCSGTSRVVVAASLADALVEKLTAIWDQVKIGHPLVDTTFMGPLINQVAVERFVAARDTARAEGMEAIRENRICEGVLGPDGEPVEGNYVRPALWRATRRPDPGNLGDHDAEEIFGPDLVVHTVADDAPDAELAHYANATPYGLAMGVFTASRSRFEALAPHLRCGVLNFNRSTVGASGHLPFGGVKMSGNHRPAASLAPRYCAYPVATLKEEPTLQRGKVMARFPDVF